MASAENIDIKLQNKWIKLKDATKGKSQYDGLANANLEAMTEKLLNPFCPNNFYGPCYRSYSSTCILSDEYLSKTTDNYDFLSDKEEK